MWYSVCESEPEHKRHVWSKVYTSRSRLKTYFKCWRLKRPGVDVWVKKDKIHPDPDYKQYICPDCGNMMSERELNNTWDWAGPHCNACGCTGMTMFSSILSQEGRKIMTGYQSIMGKFREILGNKKVDEIEREYKNGN